MKKVLSIRLIHWNRAEAQERAEILSAAGYEVHCEMPSGPEFLRELRNHPPAAIVIDLGRMPSQGRDLALVIRKNGATRGIPLVFVGGEDATVARLRGLLADAVFTSWGRIRSSLKRALSRPPSKPIVPDSVFAGYSGTPLTKKLGIKPGLTVGLIHAPEDFARLLEPLPEGSRLLAGARGCCKVLICFLRSRADLERQIGEVRERTDFASVWLAWPKKTSGMFTDLSEQQVREAGLAAGLVDYKICAIDPTWSGLLFARRK